MLGKDNTNADSSRGGNTSSQVVMDLFKQWVPVTSRRWGTNTDCVGLWQIQQQVWLHGNKLNYHCILLRNTLFRNAGSVVFSHASSMALWMAMSVHHFGPNKNISTTQCSGYNDTEKHLCIWRILYGTLNYSAAWFIFQHQTLPS